MAYRLFPPIYQIQSTDDFMTLTSEWVNNLVGEIESHDSSVEIKKVAIQDSGSIDVNGRVKVADVASTVSATAGEIRFNSATNKFQGFDGTSWQDFH
jgi:hypothetical protein